MRCHVELIGRLGEAPELVTYPNGDRFALLRLVTEEGWQDRRTGERKVKETAHAVRISKQGAVKAIERTLDKGDLVLISGILRYADWSDENGQTRRSVEIAVKGADHHVLFLGVAAREAPG